MLKVTLTRVDVLSVVKWHALTGLISGFLIGAVYFGMSFYRSAATATGYAFYYFIAIPLIYFLVTAIGSLVAGVLYNAWSGSLGGMKFEIESEDADAAHNSPPTPPKTWDGTA